MKNNSFSLSYYFDELKRRDDRTFQQSATGSRTPTVADRLAVIKSLKTAPDGARDMLSLSRSAGIKIGECQKIIDGLQREGLIEVESDSLEGNDRIRLSDRGVALT